MPLADRDSCFINDTPHFRLSYRRRIVMLGDNPSARLRQNGDLFVFSSRKVRR